MVSLGQLLIPILLAAIFVFILSAIIHMVLPIHKADYRGLPNEDEVRAAIRKGNPAPGQYMTPYCSDMKAMGTPEMVKKFTEGPVGLFYLRRPGPPTMTGSLIGWFIYCLVISIFVAYLSCHALASGTPYLQVFRIAGTAAWLGYAGATAAGSIWLGKPWSITGKEIFDGLLYGLVTAGTFGWLWPK
jgi:hypothetical protein